MGSSVNTGSDLEGYDVELSPGGEQQAGANKDVPEAISGRRMATSTRFGSGLCRNYVEWSSFSQGVTPYGTGSPSGVSATFEWHRAGHVERTVQYERS